MVRPLIIDDNEDGTLAITVKCPFCGAESTVNAPYGGAVAYYKNGALIQDAFPEMSADDREILISGICKKCQDETFEE